MRHVSFTPGPALLLRSSLAMTLAALVGSWPVRPLGAQEFDIDPHADNLVRFVSQTTVQGFDGRTSKIDGYVLLGASPLAAGSGEGSELYIEVDLASLDTGIGLRNRHMRDNYLEVKKYPYATYKGRIGEIVRAADGGFRVTADGTFSVHGVDREARIPCNVTVAGAGYHAKCSFALLLSDHHIDIPSFMFLKLNNQIQLDLDFTVVPSTGKQEGMS